MLGIYLFGQSTGKTLVVDDDWGGADHTTIQDACNNSQSGDIIRVHAGTYPESVLVEVSVDLVGNGSSDTIIDAQGVGKTVDISTSYVNLTGFYITDAGADESAVRVRGEHVSCFWNEVSGTENGNGFGITGSYSVIENNTISANGNSGIVLKNCNHARIHNNLIEDNDRDGIHFESSNSNTISYNNISQNNAYSVGAIGEFGLWLINSDKNQIRRNNISDHYDYALYLDDESDQNMIYWNWILRNANGTVQAHDDGGSNEWDNGSHGNHWSDYNAYDEDEDGYGDEDYQIDGDSSSVDRYPIWNVTPPNGGPFTWIVDDDWAGANFSTIQEAIDSSYNGDIINVHAGRYTERIVVDVRVNLVGNGSDNTVIDAQGAGKTVEITSPYVNLTGFTITGAASGDSAVKVSAEHATCWKNIVSDSNGGNGFGVTSSYCSILNNTIKNNGNSGIVLKNCDQSKVYDNVIEGNYRDGFHFERSHNNTVAYNEIRDNNGDTSGIGGEFGLWFIDSDDNLIKGNNISDHNDYAFHINENSDSNLIYDNVIYNNYRNGSQAKDNGDSNRWDNGSHGNDWSDYDGEDLDRDGYGDSHYPIDGSAGSKDRYPIWNTTINNEIPTIVIVSPTDGATIREDTIISGLAGDIDDGVVSVVVSIDGGVWTNASGTTSWSYTLKIGDLDDGTHTIAARAYDGTDWSLPDSVLISINTTKTDDPDDENGNGGIPGFNAGMVLGVLCFIGVLATITRSGSKGY